MGHDVVKVFHADAGCQCAQRTERADEDRHLAVGWRSAEQLPHDDGEILLADGEFLLLYRLIGLVPIVILIVLNSCFHSFGHFGSAVVWQGQLPSLEGENSTRCGVCVS